MGDSLHLPTAGQWSASPFQQQVYWVWAEHQQQELYLRVAQRVAEIGRDTFEAPTSAQWMWDTLIGGVMAWQKQRTDISSRLQQVYLYRLEEETQMVRMELDFLRDKAKVADWAGWQDSLCHDLSSEELVQLKEQTSGSGSCLCYCLLLATGSATASGSGFSANLPPGNS
jgi:hypothetical protein